MKTRRKKGPVKPTARIVESMWVVLYAPTSFMCERCGSSRDIGVDMPVFDPEQVQEHGAEFNRLAGEFVAEHRSCRDPFKGGQ